MRWSIVTEWKEFRSPDFDDLRRRLKRPLVFDGRNLYDPVTLAGVGFECEGIGRQTHPADARLPT